FASLFSHSDNHETIIRTLATVRKGMTRNQILDRSKVSSGGTLTKTLDELEDSGFIEKYLPYKGTKDSVYRLSDEYSMFYIRFIENTKPSKQGIWMKRQALQEYKIWAGFSFETICMKHIDQIKDGLKVAGVISTHGSWIEKSKSNGAQIDLLIDRDDNVINLCEMKFHNTPFALDKKYALEVENKKNVFVAETHAKKSIFITFITTYGLVPNQYNKQYVQKELTMDHLFAEL
ncbi:MAG: ATP-binding protein, partial [Bacteroidetes bacterium]|nr:ATP-binding protein [Bacteroidota bacterium]